MEGIVHRTISVNGINMHIAEKGEGPIILFIHGFPELWYSWRHQIMALSSLGFRAVAPDMRGYGDTDAPASPTSYSCFHVVGDLIGLLDVIAADQEKVFVVGHDWGALIAWYFCLFRPDRVKALVNMTVPFIRRNPEMKTVESLRAVYGDHYYICRFQEPGVMDAELAKIGVVRAQKIFLKPGPVFLTEDMEPGDSPNTPVILPPWLTEEDANYFDSIFKKSGFTGGLNYYRALDLNWELTAPWTGSQVKVPVKFIVGDLDVTYNSLGMKEYIHGGEFKKDVPYLQEVVVMEGAAHFCNQEKPDETNKHIYDFIQKF
ncbi:hypothetical protein L1049_016799 [Liquidambar formosana]|uniref:soluble epoxide hydrolase n=1 Tax=Liquidambar formosana TaxID=63359 RepID=A0AAP0S5W2_LIQFO